MLNGEMLKPVDAVPLPPPPPEPLSVPPLIEEPPVTPIVKAPPGPKIGEIQFKSVLYPEGPEVAPTIGYDVEALAGGTITSAEEAKDLDFNLKGYETHLESAKRSQEDIKEEILASDLSESLIKTNVDIIDENISEIDASLTTVQDVRVDLGEYLEEVSLPVVPVTPELKTVTTRIWTVTVTDPNTGKTRTEEFTSSDAAHRYAEVYRVRPVSRVPYAETIEEPDVIPTTIQIDPNLVTYMGITMTRDQFEADFPEGTIPDSAVKPTVTLAEAGEAYEDAMSALPDIARDRAKILSERSSELASVGKPWDGFLNYLGSVVYAGSAAVYDTGTFLVRPEMWSQTAQTLGYLMAPDKPETRAQHDQRIADFVAGDIEDPTMQKNVTEFLQKTMPYTPLDQKYLDEAKEFRVAFGQQIAADPFRFAVEIGASIVTGQIIGKALGNLRKNVQNYGKTNRLGDAFVEEQLAKLHPLDEAPGVSPDFHVSDMFKDMTSQTPTEFGETLWSADLYSTAEGKTWRPAYEGKGAWQNKAALDIAKDVAAKGGQQIVFLRDPVSGKLAGTMSYSDFAKATNVNPIAFAGLGVTITVVDVGEAQSILDKAVEDGIFDTGVSPTQITQNQILVTIDTTTLQTTIAELTETELKGIDIDTMLNVLPKLELDTFTKIVPDLDEDTKLVVIPMLDRDVIIDVVPELDKDTILDVIPKLDKDVIADVLPKLDTDVIIDVIQDLDDDTLLAVLPVLDPVIITDIITTIDTDIVVDVVTELDDDTIIGIIPKLDDLTIQELIPRLEARLSPGSLDYIGRRLPTKFRRKFKRAMKKRPLPKLPRTEEPEPYRVSFQYATGASETKRVDARTYHEALVIAEEQKQISLDPVEVEVETLAFGAFEFEEPAPPEPLLMGIPMVAPSPVEPKIKKPKKLKERVERERRPGPPPPEMEKPTPEVRVSDDRRRHKKEAEDPRRKRERKRRARLVK